MLSDLYSTEEGMIDTETTDSNLAEGRTPNHNGFGPSARASDLRLASPLVMAATEALRAAATIVPDEQTMIVEERNTWQPDSWLIQSCWATLADAGMGAEALAVATHLVDRQPLAPLQALYQLARRLRQQPALGPLLQHTLQQWHYRLFHTHPAEANSIERLLLVATSAALTGDRTLAAACLERLDNLAKGWERVVARPELRDQLALCIVQIGPHPLTNDLINIAIRRFDDAGAQFLFAITTLLSEELATAAQPSVDNGSVGVDNAKAERLLQHCLDTLRLSTLVTLQSRRVAAMIFGQAGEIDEVLTQVATIERVQSAQRETGYGTQKEDPKVLRQVKRTSANSDVDFLVYTLRNAIDLMPKQRLRREERIALADQLAIWGIRSDGWTAASAAGTLVNLGALRYAAEVVDHVSPQDPARSEGLLMLVRSLMALGEETMAAEQAKRALDWAESLTARNPERALTWGLAEIYLDHQRPQVALHLLNRWREPTGWRHQLRKLRGESIDDDGLRNRRLRLQALLQLAAPRPATNATDKGDTDNSASATSPSVPSRPDPAATVLSPSAFAATGSGAVDPTIEIPALLRTLRRAAPRLLEGEALIHFYTDGLLRPLLRAGFQREAWALLPDLRSALVATSGNKHAVRVREITQLLTEELPPKATILHNKGAGERSEPLSWDEVRGVVEGFLRELWRKSATRGTWQVVHSIEGALPLVLTLEGSAALVAIAEAVSPSHPDG